MAKRKMNKKEKKLGESLNKISKENIKDMSKAKSKIRIKKVLGIILKYGLLVAKWAPVIIDLGRDFNIG